MNIVSNKNIDSKKNLEIILKNNFKKEREAINQKYENKNNKKYDAIFLFSNLIEVKQDKLKSKIQNIQNIKNKNIKDLEYKLNEGIISKGEYKELLKKLENEFNSKYQNKLDNLEKKLEFKSKNEMKN